MSENKKEAKKFDKDTMLKLFMDKYGMNAIIGDIIGEMTPDMTLSEFIEGLEAKGIEDTVMDMTLCDLFNVKAKGTEPAILKGKIVELLAKKPGLTVSQIGEELKENGKHLSIALAALKKAGKLTAIGEKKAMKYTAAPAA